MLKDIIDHNKLPDFERVRKTRERKKILIIEDDRFTASLIETSISGSFTKIIANTGREALEAYILEVPNMVFLDIELPDINGLELLDLLKEIDKDIYVVILSSHGTASNVAKALDKDAKDFITKPFSSDKLIHHLNKLNCSDED